MSEGLRKTLEPRQFEEKVWGWFKDVGVETWVSTGNFLASCSGVLPVDIAAYRRQTEGRSDLERGFAVAVTGKSISHIYPFDRAAAEKEGAPTPPSIALWRKLERHYINFRNRDTSKLTDLLLAEHRNHDPTAYGSRDYTLAEVCLNVPRGLMRIQRTGVRSRMLALEQLRLLPTPLEVLMEDEDRSSSSSSSTTTAKRTRSSGDGGSISGEVNADDSDELFPSRPLVIAAAANVQAESNQGCLFSIMAEEWVLGTALARELLQVAYKDNGPKVFDSILKAAFLSDLIETGRSVPVLFNADVGGGAAADAPAGALPPPRRLLREFDLQRLFALCDAALVGRHASTLRKRRLEELEVCKAKCFAGQLFRPPRGSTLLDYLSDGCKYSGGTYRLVYTKAKGMRGSDDDDDDDDDAASPAAKRRPSLSPAKWKQNLLSHRSILYLQLIKSACEISDNKFLAFQYLLHALVLGAVPNAKEFKELTIGGKSHKQRVRQLTWRVKQDKAEQVNAAGVIFVSVDMTGLGGTEMNSQHVYWFNKKKDAPDSLLLPSPPVGAKDAAHAAGALMDSFAVAGISTAGTQGGCSDNAPNAASTVADFFELTEQAANGVNSSGETIGTLINGVIKRLLFVGSPIHQLHLFFKHWRAASVGGKTDMHDPNHLQMVYKFGAILRSDQRISKSGSCNSLYQAIINEIFGGHPQAKGWWSAIVAQEHEGRWGVSQFALAFAWRLMRNPPPGSSYTNGLAACMMAIRKLLKSGCWQLDAAMQVSVWSYAVEIRFAICMEIEIGAQYTLELNWMRSPSTRPYLSHYPSLHRLRELPGHRHNELRRFVHNLANDPWAQLPTTKQFVVDNVPEEDRDLYLARAQAGANAMKANFAKHSQYLYKEWGLVLMINGLGCAGAAARMMVVCASDLLFGSHEDLAAKAKLAVEVHKDTEPDCFFRPLFKESAPGVRHWLQQFRLVNATDSAEELRALGEEWLSLAQHACTDYKVDKVIHDEFKARFPLLHLRQQENVDMCVHDSLQDEALFSIKRRVHNPNLTGTAFEDVMFYEMVVLAPLRKWVRKLGKDLRKKKKMEKSQAAAAAAVAVDDDDTDDDDDDAANDDDDDDDAKDKDQKWCSTHAQCMALIERVESTLVPLFTDELMDKAPRIRKDLVEDDRTIGPLREGGTRANTYSSKDAAIVTGWLQSAKEKSSTYHKRELSEAELIAKATDVQLHMQLESTAIVPGPVPLYQRAEYKFSGLPAVLLKAELVCFLPFFLSCALEPPLFSWPTEHATEAAPNKARVLMPPEAGKEDRISCSPRFLALLSATLCPPYIVTTKVKSALRQAMAKREQVAADVTLDDIFDEVAVKARGGAAVSVADVAYLKRNLGLDVSEAAGPLTRERFGELFAGLSYHGDSGELLVGLCQSKRVKVAKLLLLRKEVAAATAPLAVHKSAGVLFKDRALSKLAVFTRSARKILLALGSGDGRVREGDIVDDETSSDNSGCAAAMFILGPLMMDAGRRELIGVPTLSGLGSGLPRAHPKGAFISQLSDLVVQEESAAAAALAGEPIPRA